MRKLVGALAGFGFVAVWIAGAMVLADRVHGWPWPLQFVYYAGAGFLWVIPVRPLMVWALKPRPPAPAPDRRG